MLNTLNDRYFAGYAQTQASCNGMFDVCLLHASLDSVQKTSI